MRLKVLEKSLTNVDCWKCEDESGLVHTVDLTIDDHAVKITKGCIVEVEYLMPYVEIAQRVKVVEDGK